MTRMQMTSDSSSRQLMMLFNKLSDSDLSEQNAIGALNDTIFNTWVPQVKAPNSLNGVGVTLMYENEATGELLDRTFWVYWELLKSGQYNYAYANTNLTDNMLHAYEELWPTYSTPHLGADIYPLNVTALTMGIYQLDDFFDYPLPWSASDGNSYWYFTHMRSFHTRGMWVNVQTWDVGTTWLGMMQSVLTPEAKMVAFDSQGHVMAASNEDELQRLAQCQGAIVDGSVAAECIDTNAREHPIEEIRHVYNTLHQDDWDDLSAGSLASTMTELQFNGQRYMAITSMLFSKDHLRVTVVWYQPWNTLQGNTLGLTALICILTLLSTFVLTLMGIFGVLRPLMALGNAMRSVAHNLTEGDGETEVVLEPRKPSAFKEVEEIGRDFQTIVVDFLGFSSANARDNKYAPKDTDRPFAVVFTDIQSSTGLWGQDPAEMSRCVQAHHELIRELIQEHRLYEVKTVGDSFMVTTTSPQAALSFALDIQTTFFDYNWNWDGADAMYKETTLAFLKVDSGPIPSAEYSKMWNGLRVRVGIHYGMGEVTYDEVSKGYDYYGTVVNTAARIEAVAHGGQVVVSQNLMDALPGPLDPNLGLATPLGMFPLRGVLKPPTLVEVKPTQLQARWYPPLRIEVAEERPLKVETLSVVFSPSSHLLSPKTPQQAGAAWDQSGVSNESPKGHRTSMDSSTSRLSDRRTVPQVAEDLARTHVMVRKGLLPPEMVSQQLLALHHIVEDLLKPLAPQQHSAVIKALAKGWGVPPPKGKGEFGVSGLRLVQRMSETTKVLSHFSLRTPAALRTPRDISDVDPTEEL
eukprot:GGOE01063479.1.p1 GENE.GGOE01063479.1~~GGOE01063479.1.p1  ORF type:complete len:872 (-),score=271.54 GGOE01063479.1:252-2663(-)